MTNDTFSESDHPTIVVTTLNLCQVDCGSWDLKVFKYEMKLNSKNENLSSYKKCGDVYDKRNAKVLGHKSLNIRGQVTG